MHDDYYAIVIGLGSYPRLGEPPPSNLEGPENDAEAVVAWLTDPDGGGLPAANIRTILSRDVSSPPQASPTPDDINETFLWLDGLADANEQARRGRRVGTRFYFYLSGHGCAPKPREGVLLTGNAVKNMVTANIFPMEWIDWLQDANYFREYVLWMDCCTEREIFTVPGAAPLKPRFASDGPGPEFIALAAPYGQRAVEKPIPEDSSKWHGVFTWSLISGLRGAAADDNNRITTQSLSSWLRQAQFGWLNDAERLNPDVAKSPDIIKSDPLVLATIANPYTFDVMLNIKGSESPTEIRLWSGSPAIPSSAITIPPDGAKARLRPGLYLATADNGLRHGFSVTRSSTIDLVEHGPPPAVAAGSYSLRIDPGDATAEISLFDQKFGFVETCTGARDGALLPCGLYLYRIGVGRKKVDKVILLDRNWPPPDSTTAGALPEIPLIASAAPLPGTRFAAEEHVRIARDAPGRIDRTPGDGAELFLMSRVAGTGEAAGPTSTTWRDVTLLDKEHKIVATLLEDVVTSSGPNPAASCALRLDPGAYQLRFTTKNGARAAQSLILPPGGWRLEAYLLWVGTDAVEPAITLLMRKIGADFGGKDDLLLQKALIALADERVVAEGEFAESLLDRIDNPLAAVVGAHLLIIAYEKRNTPLPERLSALVTRLRSQIGAGYPDLEALAYHCPDQKGLCTGPIESAPMFERSWRLLIGESLGAAQGSAGDLIPVDLWKEVNALIPAPPYLRWSTDPVVQSALLAAQAAKVQSMLPAQSPSPPQPVAKGSWVNAISGALRSWIGRPAPTREPVGVPLEKLDEIRLSLRTQAKRMGLPASALDALKNSAPGQSMDGDAAKPLDKHGDGP